MKKRIIISGVMLVLVTIVYIVASSYISKLSDDIDKKDHKDNDSLVIGCVDFDIESATIMSVNKDNTFTVMLNKDFDYNDKSYKKGDCIQINKKNFSFPDNLENEEFKYIDRKIKSAQEYEYYPWKGDNIHLWYSGEGIDIGSPSQMWITEYGSRITGTVVSTRVLSREPIKDNNTENIRTQECATIKIDDISCEQEECTFKKGDIVELMYGSVYSDGNESLGTVLQKGDKVSYGFGRHDSERYGEYKQKAPFIMTPLRVDLES